MTGSVRWGRKGRALALAGGFACCTGVFAQEPVSTPDAQSLELEQVLQALERMEAEQRALRQEVEALRVQRDDSLTQGPDAAELEGEMDPAALFEAEEESPVQEGPPEIARILEELSRLEGEQQALREEIENLWSQRDGLTVQGPADPVSESEEASGLRDESADQGAAVLAIEEEGMSASASSDDPAQDGTAVLPGEEPAFSPKLYEPAAKLYEQGREEFRNLNFYDAARIFREFLIKYPAHGDAGEARYWLGEALYVEGRFQDAIAAFAEVIAADANPRREVARLKTGYAWFELGDFEQARAILVEVRDQNPDSDLARLAQLRLDRLQRLVGREQ